jgi:hypothetical protein
MEAAMRSAPTEHSPEVTTAEALCGIALVVMSFGVVASVCSGIVELSLMP